MKTYKFSQFLVIMLAIVLFTGNAFAQKGAESLSSKPKVVASNTNSVVHSKGTLLESHIKSLGTVGKTHRYEIISARQRGLDSPNNSTMFVYDNQTDSLTVVASSGGAGLGGAIVQASGYAVGQYLFFSKYKPDQYNQNVNSGNEGGGTTVNASATGGNGGSSSATGGAGGVGGTSSATGGNSTATSTASGGHGGAGGNGGTVNNTGQGTPNVEVNVNSGAANGQGTINVGSGTRP